MANEEDEERRYFAELVARQRPAAKIRQLEREAGLPQNSIAQYMKPSRGVRSMPDGLRVAAIARVLRCEGVEVVRAFAADLGLPYELSEEEGEMVRLMRRLSPRDRGTLRKIVRVMLEDPNPEGK